MPIVGTDRRIYEVRLKSTYIGNEQLNVFYYSCPIQSQPSAADVANNFQNETLQGIIPTVKSLVNFYAIEVIDHMDVANFGLFAINQNGTRGGTASMASFMCWSLRLNRTSRDVRNGWKRFSGLDEADIENNNFTAAYLTVLENQVSDIIQNLNINLVVLPLLVVTRAPTKKDPQINPDNAETWRYTVVGSGTVPNRVTTQNSRKIF